MIGRTMDARTCERCGDETDQDCYGDERCATCDGPCPGCYDGPGPGEIEDLD